MMLTEPVKLHHIFKPWFTFRSAVTGEYVSRAYALLHPNETVAERRGG